MFTVAESLAGLVALIFVLVNKLLFQLPESTQVVFPFTSFRALSIRQVVNFLSSVSKIFAFAMILLTFTSMAQISTAINEIMIIAILSK